MKNGQSFRTPNISSLALSSRRSLAILSPQFIAEVTRRHLYRAFNGSWVTSRHGWRPCQTQSGLLKLVAVRLDMLYLCIYHLIRYGVTYSLAITTLTVTPFSVSYSRPVLSYSTYLQSRAMITPSRTIRRQLRRLLPMPAFTLHAIQTSF